MTGIEHRFRTMTNSSIRYLFSVALCCCFLGLLPTLEAIEADSEKYHIELVQQGFQDEVLFRHQQNAAPFVVRVTEKARGIQSQIEIQKWAGRIREMSLVGDSLIVIGGGPYSAVAHVIDLAEGEVVDTIRCWSPRLSPSKRYILYVGWHPRINPPEAQTPLVVYDLTKTPLQNRPNVKGRELFLARKERDLDRALSEPILVESNVGFPIFPEKHAREKSFREWVPSEGQRQTPLRFDRRSRLWSQNDEKYVLLDHRDNSLWLAVLDLTDGPEALSIRKKRLDGILKINRVSGLGEILGSEIEVLIRTRKAADGPGIVRVALPR